MADAAKCPNCGSPMQILDETDMRICTDCKTLVWEEAGQTEWSVPEKLSPEEAAAIERLNHEIREYPKLIIPHSDHGDPECCGLIMAEANGDQANLVCNECGMVLDTVPKAEADQKLAEMASDEICSGRCPHCGQLNIFQGFSFMMTYTCRHCGEGVSIKQPIQ